MKLRKEEVLARRLDSYKKAREEVMKTAVKEHQDSASSAEAKNTTKTIRFKLVRPQTVK